MIKLSQTGVGTKSATSVEDSHGSGYLPVQAHGDGVTTFRVLGRVASDAPWVELKAAGTADFLEAVTRVPQIQLEVTSGAGAVSLWIGDN